MVGVSGTVKTWKKFLLGGAIGGMAMLLAGAWALLAFTNAMCANDVLVEAPSPDGSLRAVVFVRNCGATTRYSTQVSVLPSTRHLPNDFSRLFVAETGYEPSGNDPKGQPAVSLEWLSLTQLEVRYPAGSNVVRQNTKTHGVSVSYDELQWMSPLTTP